MIKNKRAVSGVVTVVLLIALVLAITAIVWGVVQNLVRDELGDAESCFGNFGKVEINNAFTCYNETSDEFQFSISIGEIDISGLLVSITGDGSTKSLRFEEGGLQESYLKPYQGSYNEIVTMPGENSGKTYVLDMSGAGISGNPGAIEIAPIMGGTQCEVADSLYSIDSCNSLA